MRARGVTQPRTATGASASGACGLSLQRQQESAYLDAQKTDKARRTNT